MKDISKMKLYSFNTWEPRYIDEEPFEMTKSLYIAADKDKVKKIVESFLNDPNQEDKWDLPTFTGALEDAGIDYAYPREASEEIFDLAYPENE